MCLRPHVLIVMSQTTTRPDDSEQSRADLLVDEVEYINELLGSLDDDAVEQMSDQKLVELRSAIKELESTVDDVRKKRVDGELKDRIEPGERLFGLSHVESHSKFVAEDVGTVIMRAVSAGVDYTDFVDLKASALADSEVEAEIGRNEYTYLR